MRKQYHLRPTERGYLAWDIDRLVRLTAALPRKWVIASEIRNLDETYWFQDESSRPTCREVIEHMRLIEGATFEYPIILSSDGRVMDGMHRVAKAILAGVTEVEAVQFDEDPQPDYIGIHPDDLPYD